MLQGKTYTYLLISIDSMKITYIKKQVSCLQIVLALNFVSLSMTKNVEEDVHSRLVRRRVDQQRVHGNTL